MNIEINKFQQIFKEILEGKSLRSIEKEYGINRNSLMDRCKELFSDNQKEMNKFEKILQYNEKEQLSIEISNEKMKNIANQIFDREITLVEASGLLNVDISTFKEKMFDYIKNSDNIETIKKYIEYQSRINPDYSYIDFKALLIQMIKGDFSQSDMSTLYSIPVRTIGREIEKLKDDEHYKDLYDLCKENANRKMKKIEFTQFEKDLMNKVLEKYDEKFVIVEPSKSKRQLEYERAKSIINIADNFEGTQKEKANEAGVSISTLRRMRLSIKKFEDEEKMKRDMERDMERGEK